MMVRVTRFEKWSLVTPNRTWNLLYLTTFEEMRPTRVGGGAIR